MGCHPPRSREGDAARVRRDALACRRSTAALAVGAFARPAQLQARLPGTWREHAIRTNVQPGTKIAHRSAGVTRARLSQSRECTSRTGRNAGQHDARSRPGAECIAPRAGTAPAPLPGVPSAEGVLYRAGVCCITEPATFVNEMVTRSVTVHYRLPISSLPDLIRQSMTPRRPMDHRVKPGGDDQEARSVTSSRSGVLYLRLTAVRYCGPRRHCERRKAIQPAAKSWIALTPRSSRRGLSRLDFWRKRLLQSAPTGATQKPPKASSGLILVFVVAVFINFERPLVPPRYRQNAVCRRLD